MQSGETLKSKWLEPQTLFGVVGLLGLGYSSYMSFQSDVTGRVGALEIRIAVMEANSAQTDKRLDRLTEQQERGSK